MCAEQRVRRPAAAVRRLAGAGGAARAVRAGGDLPVGDPQPRVAAVQLDIDRAGRERPVVQVAAVRVVECLGELADHLQTGLQRQVRGWPAMKWSRRCQSLPCRKTTAGPASSSSLYCSARTMPVVGDALQGEVLAVRGALDGLPVVVGRGPLGEVDPDPARMVGRQRRVGRRGSPPRSGRSRRTSAASS